METFWLMHPQFLFVAYDCTILYQSIPVVTSTSSISSKLWAHNYSRNYFHNITLYSTQFNSSFSSPKWHLITPSYYFNTLLNIKTYLRSAHQKILLSTCLLFGPRRLMKLLNKISSRPIYQELHKSSSMYPLHTTFTTFALLCLSFFKWMPMFSSLQHHWCNFM